MPNKPVTTATELLHLMENTLGLAPDIGYKQPIWKWRQQQAGRINKKRVEDPNKFTWANLELAVAYCWKNRLPTKGVLGIFYFVDDALKVAADMGPQGSISDLIDEAIRQERLTEHEGWREWITRLNRAVGPYRAEVYEEWKAART